MTTNPWCHRRETSELAGRRARERRERKRKVQVELVGKVEGVGE